MKYLTCAETAKLIRKALKEAFPVTKFSVRSSVYSGGASIDISWVDGPTTKQVDKVALVFQGSYFDGMQDYKGVLRNMYQGEQISFGADFVFTRREHSDELVLAAIADVSREYAGNLARDNVTLDLEAYRNGSLYRANPFNPGKWDSYWNYQAIIGRTCAEHTIVEPLESTTANCVIRLGNDGCSQRGALRVAA